MVRCKNCGETDLLESDLCGNYCVYCFDYDEIAKQNSVKKDEGSTQSEKLKRN